MEKPTNTQKLERLRKIETEITIIKSQIKNYKNADWSRGGRQHRLHKYISGNWEDGSIIIGCGTSLERAHCSCRDWESVECIFCLRNGLKKLKQEANKIGEFIGCGREFIFYIIRDGYDDDFYIKLTCDKYNNFFDLKEFCPICQEANEILARINNEC